MIVCVPLAGDGKVDPRWGRADRVAVARVDHGAIDGWEEFAVGWGELHDQGSEGSHHARIAKFLKEHGIEAVVAHHVGEGMQRMLNTMGIQLYVGAAGDARDAVLSTTD